MKMKKSVILALATLGIVACASACNVVEEQKSGTITGVEILRFKAGEATDAKLLENVEVTLSDGTTTTPEIKKENVDYSKAGEYEITYKYGVSEIKTTLYIYETPVFYYGENELSETMSLTYREANASYNFSKAVEAVDSFGEALEFTRTDDSDTYDGGVGEYVVTYLASDCVGNTAQKTVTYTVTAENAPVVSNSTVVLGKDSGYIPVDWKGAMEAYVYLDGVLLSADDYVMTSDALGFDSRYYLSLGLGEHAFRVKTVEGYTDFTITVEDEGYPVFAMDSILGLYTIGTTKAVEPTKLIDSHEEYTYAYALKDKEGNEYAVTDEFGYLTFVDSTNEFIPVGDYILTVTGIADDGIKTSEKSYSFSVTTPTLSGGESSTINEVTLDSAVYGVEKAYRFVKEDKDAWGGRLQSSIPAGVFRSIEFDFYVEDCSEKNEEEGLINTTFALCVNGIYTPTAPNIKFFDKTTGEEVAQENLKLGQWYFVVGDLALQTNDGSFYFYVAPYGGEEPTGVDAYIANLKFNLIGNTLTPALWVKHDSGATIKGGVNSDGEYVLSYSNSGSAEWGSRAGFSLPMLEKYQLYYNHITEDMKYELAFEMRFTSEPAKVQFWTHTEAGYGATPTLASMISSGMAKAYNALGLLVSEFEEGVWYEIRIDMEKLGWLADNDGNIGLQFGALASMEFKNAVIEEKRQSLSETENFLQKLSAGASISMGIEDGVVVGSYSNSSESEWNGRVQLTTAMLANFKKFQNLCDDKKAYLLTFELQFTSTPATLQFWQITSAGMNSSAPTLAGFISSGIVIAKDSEGKQIAGESEMVQGEWYTVSFRLANMLALDESGGNVGLQLASNGSFKYRNVRFEETAVTLTLFQAVSSGAIVVTPTDGDFVQKITKSGTQNNWDSRTGMTKKAYDEYMSALATTGYVMQFKLQYVSGAGNNWQFWNASTEPTPTLSSLVANGTIAITDSEGNAVAVANMQNGVTYTITVDIDKMGTCRETATEYGWQFGINEASFEMLVSSVSFIKKA